jgi:hypothetical protein
MFILHLNSGCIEIISIFNTKCEHDTSFKHLIDKKPFELVFIGMYVLSSERFHMINEVIWFYL